MILVTGGTGNVGANLVRELLDAGEKVRLLSREPGGRSFPDGAEAVSGDLNRLESLPQAVSGVERAFLMAPAFADIGGFLTAARQAGVRHVVLLSSSSVLAETPGFIGEQHQRLEKAVLDSGLPWTFLRPGAFMTNDLAWAPQIGAGDVIRGVYPNAETAPVDPRDIAAVAAHALLEWRVGHAPVLTGPQSLSQIDRVRIIAEAIRRPLRFQEVPPEQFREQMLHHGMIAPVIDQLIAGLAARDSKAADISPAVETITGRPAFTYAQWATHRASAIDPALV